jgi:glutaredoxin 3
MSASRTDHTSHTSATKAPATKPAGRQHKVIVFTTPTCSWCVRVKKYLRERQVPFREVDVARDMRAARDLQRRTGQTGVPVIQVDTSMVVGFDKPKLDRLLGLR